MAAQGERYVYDPVGIMLTFCQFIEAPGRSGWPEFGDVKHSGFMTLIFFSALCWSVQALPRAFVQRQS